MQTLSTPRKNLFLLACKFAKLSSFKRPTLAISLKLLEKLIYFRKPVEDVYIALPMLKVLMVFLLRNFGVSAVSEEGPKAWQGACKA